MSDLTVTPPGRLSRAEFQGLAEVPPEAEWFANIDNEKTRRAYRIDLADFMSFTGIRAPDEIRLVSRAHVIAWRKALEARALSGATIRRKLAALSSLFEHLCEQNAVTHNPVKGVKRPRADSNEGKTPALGDAQARALLDQAVAGGAQDTQALALRDRLNRLQALPTSGDAHGTPNDAPSLAAVGRVARPGRRAVWPMVGIGAVAVVLAAGWPSVVEWAASERTRPVPVASAPAMPALPVKIMMNVGNPDRAFAFANLPNKGVGLARLEFIINRMIGIHPRALVDYARLGRDLQETIEPLIAAYPNPREFFITRLTEGISTIAAAFNPHPVIVRLSDFKSNEYANLIAGNVYEPEEENPMLGFRGASRYIAESFRPCFEMECEALKRVRDRMGLTNVEVMVPFVRTPDEARQVIELLGACGLERGKNGLRVIMMCELPSNALLAEDFLQYFDGFSIGSNDLTQLTLGLDRDSGLVAHLFDERNPPVKALMARAIHACRAAGKYIGICGQGPSDHEDLAAWLFERGIESISLNPDTVVETWIDLAGRHGGR